MKRIVVLILAALTAASVAAAADLSLALQPGSKLGLNGTSTMHAWHADATQLNVLFTHEAAAWESALPRGEAMEKLIRAGGVKKLDLTVIVNGLKSGKDGLDKNMYKALLAEKHPEIRFVMAGYDVADAQDGAMAIDAKGKITVAGVEREIAMKATAAREGDAIRLRGDVPLKMTWFNIKPPTMMMGTLRTGDEVTVHYDLLIGASEPPLAGDSAGGSR
jgi:polyisoprenoid-binding protein YceI